MPLISFIPTTAEAEAYLFSETAQLQLKLTGLAAQICGVPLDDVIVRAFRNPILVADPKDAAVHIRVENNPNERIEASADFLRDTVVSMWKAHYTHTDKYREFGSAGYLAVEIWVQFLDGSWGLSKLLDGDLLTEEVPHIPRPSMKTLRKGAKAFFDALDAPIPTDIDSEAEKSADLHLSDVAFRKMKTEGKGIFIPDSYARKKRHLQGCLRCQT